MRGDSKGKSGVSGVRGGRGVLEHVRDVMGFRVRCARWSEGGGWSAKRGVAVSKRHGQEGRER